MDNLGVRQMGEGNGLIWKLVDYALVFINGVLIALAAMIWKQKADQRDIVALEGRVGIMEKTLSDGTASLTKILDAYQQRFETISREFKDGDKSVLDDMHREFSQHDRSIQERFNLQDKVLDRILNSVDDLLKRPALPKGM